MKLGIFSDVHGNASALKNCLEFLKLKKVDQLFFLGDIVGYLPNPTEALQTLEQSSAYCLMGNHDAMILGQLEIAPQRDAVYQLGKIKNKISSDWLDKMRLRSPRHSVVLNGKKCLFVHGSPTDPLCGYIYPDTPLDEFKNLEVDVVFMGHTHRPFVRSAGPVLMVNVGSVGLPRDSGTLSSLAIYDTESGHCEIFRIPFDPQPLIEGFGSELHPSVRECFNRIDTHLFGTIA